MWMGRPKENFGDLRARVPGGCDHATWVLGIDPTSSARAASVLTTELSLQPQRSQTF